MANKLMTAKDVVASIEDGMTIGIGGWGPRRKPMALVRELLRSPVKDLTVVAYGGADVGMLCAAGKVKKLTNTAGPVAGACIRLGKAGPAGLGIAEGIETALAARLASGLPTVAAYSAAALAAWHWPRDLRRLVIFADADQAGTDAASSLRARAFSAGLQCEVMAPSTPGADWCDVWAARDESEVPA